MAGWWPLTGHSKELLVVGEALADDDYQGKVIAGPAGVGKTRLARAATETAARAGWSVSRVAPRQAGTAA
ncbi:hypothetical protein JNN96_24535 [Mycobacterium sp. DSM 3803]|nr:hypothetical protein [Mycobacterium sp. DSM 3803]OKH64342.1 hypothetical protein EB73_24530 [Mycobacterium sp. SWH-M3]